MREQLPTQLIALLARLELATPAQVGRMASRVGRLCAGPAAIRVGLGRRVGPGPRPHAVPGRRNQCRPGRVTARGTLCAVQSAALARLCDLLQGTARQVAPMGPAGGDRRVGRSSRRNLHTAGGLGCCFARASVRCGAGDAVDERHLCPLAAGKRRKPSDRRPGGWPRCRPCLGRLAVDRGADSRRMDGPQRPPFRPRRSWRLPGPCRPIWSSWNGPACVTATSVRGASS